jgi:outer membrane protein assembly factor BamC
LQGDKVDYKTTAKVPSLEVPPDLSQMQRDNRYTVPSSGSVSASALNRPAAGQAGAVRTGSNVLPPIEGMRLERNGDQRFLVVNRKADDLWNPVREFWQDQGFNLVKETAEAGVMETDWAENRAKLPKDFVRNTLGRIAEGLYDTGERDKFRTRFERNGDTTEIYISHRGLEEKLVGGSTSQQQTGTIWTQRPSDPALELEFLRLLMVRLGESEAASKQKLAAAVNSGAAQAAAPQRAAAAQLVTLADKQQAVQINETFERAWRRVGVALDRGGFTVEDRDRAKGVYFVRYVDPEEGRKDDRGFFSRIFGSEPKIDPTRYQVTVKPQGSSTQVTVAPMATPKSDATGKILALLADQLK